MTTLTAALTGHFAARHPRPFVVAGTAQTHLERVEAFATLFWRLNEASGLTFAEGVSGALPFTGTNPIERIAQSLAQDDGVGASLGLKTHGSSGTSVLTRANNAAFNVEAGGWGLKFQLDDLDDKHILIMRDGAGGAGTFSNEVLGTGQLRTWRRDGTGTLREIVTGSPVITIGQPHSAWFDFGPAGLRSWLDGTLVANEATPTTNWATSSADDIRAGRWYTGVAGLDGVIGWLVFRNSQPTAQEIASLAATQGVRLITGVNLGTVVDGGQIVFTVRDHGHYAPGAVTATDGGHGVNVEVGVSGEDVTVTGIEVDVAETFNIGATDSVGAITAATFTIEVTEAGGGGAEHITTPEIHGWSSGNTTAQNTTDFRQAISDASTNAF